MPGYTTDMRCLTLLAFAFIGCSRIVDSFSGGTAPESLSYASNPAIYHQALPIAPNLATVTVSATSFTVSPALPNGLILDPLTGAISGTPAEESPSANYGVTASNAAGETHATLSLTVTGTPPSLTFPSNNYVFVVGRALTAQPVNAGGAIGNCTAAATLPSGLVVDATTCAISGPATVATAKATYTLSATYDGGDVSANVTLTVVNPIESLSTVGDFDRLVRCNAPIHFRRRRRHCTVRFLGDPRPRQHRSNERLVHALCERTRQFNRASDGRRRRHEHGNGAKRTATRRWPGQRRSVFEGQLLSRRTIFTSQSPANAEPRRHRRRIGLSATVVRHATKFEWPGPRHAD